MPKGNTANALTGILNHPYPSTPQILAQACTVGNELREFGQTKLEVPSGLEVPQITQVLQIMSTASKPETSIIICEQLLNNYQIWIFLMAIAYCSMSHRLNSFYTEQQPEFTVGMGDFLQECGLRANRPRVVQAVMRGTTAKYEAIVAARKAHPIPKGKGILPQQCRCRMQRQFLRHSAAVQPAAHVELLFSVPARPRILAGIGFKLIEFETNAGESNVSNRPVNYRTGLLIVVEQSRKRPRRPDSGETSGTRRDDERAEERRQRLLPTHANPFEERGKSTRRPARSAPPAPGDMADVIKRKRRGGEGTQRERWSACQSRTKGEGNHDRYGRRVNEAERRVGDAMRWWRNTHIGHRLGAALTNSKRETDNEEERKEEGR
ncbi:hypothetical protein C8R46DRAFT_1313888 [Mycena filopes]|nr:hypothetical protein C8R46DRAFT_1313888 [Mycena filopes]